MKLELVTAQTDWVVSSAEATAHLLNQNITTNDTAYVTTLIKAIQKKVEEDCDLKLSDETYKLYLDEFPTGDIEMWLWPVKAITHVKYYDTTPTQQTISNTNYKTDLVGRPARIVPYDSYVWPDTKSTYPNAVEIQFTTGFTSPAVVPYDIKQAMLLVLADWYVNREDKGRRFNRVSEVILNKYKYI